MLGGLGGRLRERRGGPLLALLRGLPARLRGAQELDLVAERVDLLARERGLILGEGGADEIGGVAVGREAASAFTYIFNMTGQPAATVPCGFTKTGLPIGLQIIGRRYDDVTVLRASAAFEAAQPWAQRRPDMADR